MRTLETQRMDRSATAVRMSKDFRSAGVELTFLLVAAKASEVASNGKFFLEFRPATQKLRQNQSSTSLEKKEEEEGASNGTVRT